jgi:putative transposase
MRKINRTYKFRLYPNNYFGCARFVYNYFLNQRKEQYRLTGKSDNYYAQAKALTALKKRD